jgi:hypothetical protein
MENALAYCSGSFQVTTEKENLTVKIKAGHLQWYVHSYLIRILVISDIILTYLLR